MTTMVVMLKIAMTYLVDCQLTGTWRMHVQELSLTPFFLLLLRISGFTSSICEFYIFIFLSYSFWIHGHPPQIKKIRLYVSVLLSIWQLIKLDLCQIFNCISQILRFSSPGWQTAYKEIMPRCELTLAWNVHQNWKSVILIYWFYLFLPKAFYVKVDFFICKWKCRDPVPDLESARKISRELIRPTFWIRETLAWFWFEDDHDDDIDYDDYDCEHEIDKGD